MQRLIQETDLEWEGNWQTFNGHITQVGISSSLSIQGLAITEKYCSAPSSGSTENYDHLFVARWSHDAVSYVSQSVKSNRKNVSSGTYRWLEVALCAGCVPVCT